MVDILPAATHVATGQVTIKPSAVPLDGLVAYELALVLNFGEVGVFGRSQDVETLHPDAPPLTTIAAAGVLVNRYPTAVGLLPEMLPGVALGVGVSRALRVAVRIR
jgi:hypothetical protein